MAMIYFFAKPILPPGVTENRTHSQKVFILKNDKREWMRKKVNRFYFIVYTFENAIYLMLNA